jgi:hypothetical protein
MRIGYYVAVAEWGLFLVMDTNTQREGEEGSKMAMAVLGNHPAITRYYWMGKLLLKISLDF